MGSGYWLILHTFDFQGLGEGGRVRHPGLGYVPYDGWMHGLEGKGRLALVFQNNGDQHRLTQPLVTCTFCILVKQGQLGGPAMNFTIFFLRRQGKRRVRQAAGGRRSQAPQTQARMVMDPLAMRTRQGRAGYRQSVSRSMNNTSVV